MIAGPGLAVLGAWHDGLFRETLVEGVADSWLKVKVGGVFDIVPFERFLRLEDFRYDLRSVLVPHFQKIVREFFQKLVVIFFSNDAVSFPAFQVQPHRAGGHGGEISFSLVPVDGGKSRGGTHRFGAGAAYGGTLLKLRPAMLKVNLPEPDPIEHRGDD